MSQAPTSPVDTDEPLNNFSQCHAGIVRHLDTFGELPALLAPAQRAREVAEDIVKFFRAAAFEHHEEEERELFPAVLGSSAPGEERALVKQMIDALTREHRDIEKQWNALEPQLKKVAKGQAVDIDPQAIASLVAQYKAHARFEELEFLPLSEKILGRNSDHMAALGLPLLGDRFYPQVNDCAPDDFSDPLQLLARKLAFDDPLNGQRLEFVSQLALKALP